LFVGHPNHGQRVLLPAFSQPACIDTSKTSSKAFLDVLGAIEGFKHSAAVKAINADLAAARVRGVPLGRPQTVDREAVLRLRERGMTGSGHRKGARVAPVQMFSVSCERAARVV